MNKKFKARMIKCFIVSTLLLNVCFATFVPMMIPVQYNNSSTGCDNTCQATLNLCNLKPTAEEKKECFQKIIDDQRKEDEDDKKTVLWIFFTVMAVIAIFLLLVGFVF